MKNLSFDPAVVPPVATYAVVGGWLAIDGNS